MAGKTTLDERNLDFLGARVPDELQDKLAELYRRGYRATEIVKEGIRAVYAREELMNRSKISKNNDAPAQSRSACDRA
jgi:hypothetical protein